MKPLEGIHVLRISHLREEAIWSVNIPEPDTGVPVPPMPNQV